MTLINAARFAAFAPKALPGTLAALEAAATEYHLTDPLVLAHWLGQMHVESAGYTRLSESLNYSVEGLLKTFGRHRISAADCERYGRTPTRKADQEAIANRVYGGDWGIRLRPAGIEGAWSLEDASQWGETHLVISDANDLS